MKTINYRKDVSLKKDSNGNTYLEPKFVSKEIETDFIKQYRNCLANLCRLSTLSTRYILFIVDEMGNDNMYRNDITNKEKFVAEMSKLGHTHNVGSLDKVITELEEVGFIERCKRGVFQVNPELFWKDSEDNRIDKIKLSLEFNYKEKVKVLLNKQ